MELAEFRQSVYQGKNGEIALAQEVARRAYRRTVARSSTSLLMELAEFLQSVLARLMELAEFLQSTVARVSRSSSLLIELAEFRQSVCRKK
jgi:hypothetical protein